MFHVSQLINGLSTSSVSITIIDGQNEGSIANHTDSEYNPCLPMKLNDAKEVNITFTANVTSFVGWYPSICTEHDEYGNEYMFDGARRWNIENLRVEDYAVDKNGGYGLIRSANNSGDIKCTECRFVNITNVLSERPLLVTNGSFHLSATTFSGITTNSSILSAKHPYSVTYATREFSLLDCRFSSITGHSHLLELQGSLNDVKCSLHHFQIIKVTCCFPQQIYKPSLSVHDAVFENIHLSTGCNVVADSLSWVETEISSSIISDTNASFYHSTHVLRSEIQLHSIAVTSSTLWRAEDEAFLSFNNFDNVFLSRLNITYFYDVQNCNFSTTNPEPYGPNITNPFGIGSALLYQCPNPMTFMENSGQMEMNDIRISVMMMNTVNATANHLQFWYHKDDEYGFIINDGNMSILNMTTQRSLGYRMIYNEGTLSVNGLNLECDGNDDFDQFDVNGLNSKYIIYCPVASALNIFDSHFVGSYIVIYIRSGSLNISQSTFKYATYSISTYGRSITVNNCHFSKCGRFYGPYYGLQDAGLLAIFSTENTYFINNTFTGYNPHGFLWLNKVNDAVFTDNTFEIDGGGLLYDIDPKQLGFWNFAAFGCQLSSGLKLVGNTFSGNDIDVATPWIYFIGNQGTMCLSGNRFYLDSICNLSVCFLCFPFVLKKTHSFSNYAFSTINTNVTSCARPDLLQNVLVEGIDSRIYGPIDSEIFHEIGTFSVDDDDIPFIFKVSGANVVLDNLQIAVSPNNTTNPIMFGVSGGTTLIVDSAIENGYDLSYDTGHCTVIHNDRLAINHAMISWLMFECESSEIGEENKLLSTLSSENTIFVDHFSASTLWFEALSTSYFPGGDAMFNYTVSDRLGNQVDGERAENTTIQLYSDSFVSYFGIDAEGHCQICEEGVWFSSISVDSDFDFYTLHISMDNELFVLQQNTITFNITGCPSGYGVGDRDAFCSICDPGTYNLEEDGVTECNSCGSDENSGVYCFDGSIFISKGVWIGFEGTTIISAICPSSLCCLPNEGQYCDYIEGDASLCAKNRDHHSFLCGKCVDGFSESVISTNCMICQETVQWGYLSVPLSMAAMWTLFILCTNRESTKYSKMNHVTVKSDDVVIIMGSLGAVTVYYQQALSQLMSGSGSTYWSVAFLGLFEISAQRVASGTSVKGADWCFINGLDAKTKILLDLLTPFSVFWLLFFVFAFSQFVVRKQLRIWKKAVDFHSAALSAYLLIIGKVLITLFRLISCQSVGRYTVHFYFGYEECFGTTWVVAVVVLLIITLSFGAVFVFGGRLAKNQLYDPNTLIFKLCERYKPEYWYWEYVIFVRRIFIAYFAVNGGGVVYKSVFLSLVLLLIILQWKLSPFVSKEANVMEGVLLSGVQIVIASQILMESSDDMFFSIQLTAMVLLPMILLMYFALRILYKEYVHRFTVPQWLSPSTSSDDQVIKTNSTENGTATEMNIISDSESDVDRNDESIVIPANGIELIMHSDEKADVVNMAANNDVDAENEAETEDIVNLRSNTCIKDVQLHLRDGIE